MSSITQEPSNDLRASDAIRVITLTDFCDRCPAHAVAIVLVGKRGELYLCGHHYRENRSNFDTSRVSFRRVGDNGLTVDDRAKYELQ